MTPLELNYNIYDKELLAIVTALKKIASILTGNNRTIYCQNRPQELNRITNNKGTKLEVSQIGRNII